MTSDDLFWRLVLASRSLDEATLLWWLAASRADESPYRVPATFLERFFGLKRVAVRRVRQELEAEGLVTTRILSRHSTQYKLDAAKMLAFIRPSASGHLDTAQSWSALYLNDPQVHCEAFQLPMATARSRICMLLGSRDEGILVAWLLGARAHINPLFTSSRDMESALGGLVDRRTAMRALTRLQSAGYVAIKPSGRAGTEYRLEVDAFEMLLTACPFPEDAAATMPGWANLNFPLLQRLGGGLLAGVEPTQAAEVAALEA